MRQCCFENGLIARQLDAVCCAIQSDQCRCPSVGLSCRACRLARKHPFLACAKQFKFDLIFLQAMRFQGRGNGHHHGFRTADKGDVDL